MLNLLSKDRIVNETGLRAALHYLDAVSSLGATALRATVEHMLSSPHIFAYIISVWDRREAMISQVMTDFPTKSQDYPASIARKMLDNLSMSFLALPAESLAMDISRDISRHRGFIEGALPVLCALNTMKFADAGSFEDEIDLHDVESDDGFVKKKVPQKMRKRNRPKAQTVVDTSLFVRLGAVVPLTNEAAASLSTYILAKLKNALSFYLSLLRRTELAGDIQALLLPNVGESAKDVAPEVSSTEDVESPTNIPNAYQMVQPMKAALYFDNADGFGEWRILISTEAYRNLREFRRTNKKILKIIVKKIKQLSNGHFSDDNHKRLNGLDAGIPIYDAEITRDLRLIYQIDCVPDQDGKSERQVIKVYGIYTHAQLGGIWNALGSHLARKGREYRRRCIFRNRPVISNDCVILPASFPLAEPEAECLGSPLDLSDKDMDHLHSLLVLEKYVTFSQAFLHSLIANQDVQHVFVLTPQEQNIVECTTSCYVLGRSGTGKTTTMLFKILGIQRAWEMSGTDMPKPRQIFVTKSRVLATKVEEYFTKLLESLALAGYTLEELARMKAQSVQEGLVDLDDLPDSQMNIPMRYSELEDKHFPLFVTFDRLAKMIAADILSKDVSKIFSVDDAEAHDCFVTYDVFANQYWPHFPQNLTKNLNPWLVFSEFMGIIKGSEHALACPEGILDRPNYLRLPHRSNPNFANQRGMLYDIFEYYTKLKRQRRHHDVADRTHAILKVLPKFPGQQIDYLYVDEAQDNLLIDALFLRQLCRNPNGLFWAGDTAQTISAGSSFRFDDLKAFLYRVEQQNISVNSAGACLHQPMMFQLAINYRSHGGIVNCAHSVIELITKFWPNTIDNLRPEKGVVDGLKPVFFTGWDNDTVRYEQFLFGASGSHIEFGAQQCILVRDDAARQKLRDQVGEIGLIMTLYESKGLEFNDVLLYNFFEDSVVDLSRWRVVLNGIDDQEHAPDFDRDEARYAGVCSELKLLYVGITRARKNMWIVDKSDKSDPMRRFWTSRNQVQNCTPGTDVPHLAVSSTPEEWANFGRSLFSHKRYSQAVHCFERANLPREVKVCEAYQLREVARSSVGVALPSDQKRAFNVAADAFADCGATATGNQKLQYYRNSADCYVRAGDDLQAAKAYFNAQEFEQAAKRYRKVGRFDKTLRVLDEHGTNIPEETTAELWNVCRLFYCSRNNTQPPLPLFSSFDEEIEFLEDYDLDYARASLLESHSKYYEAAELHLSENRPLEAARAFIKDDSNVDSTTRAADTILEYFWRKCSFRITAKSVVDEQMPHFIALADQLETSKLTPATRDLISMFQNISRGNHEPLRSLALAFQGHHNRPAALLCLDHIFSRVTDIRTFTVDEMQRFLQQFYAYARLLYLILTFPDPMEHRGIQRLFSVMRLSGDEFLIPVGTFLHNKVIEIRQDITWVSEHPSGYTASRKDVTQLLQQSIRTILKDKVSEVDDMCCNSPVFSQCMQFLISGSCRRDNCPQEHVAVSKLDRQYYNGRVAIHIWQILILQLMYSAHPYIERRNSMRDWLKHLYEAINPPFFIQGSPADLDMNMMPLRLDGMKVVKLWIRESFYSLDPFYTQAEFLTMLMGITSLSFAFDRSDAPAYISRAKCTISGPLELVRKGDKRYMVHDLLGSYHGAARSSISSGISYLLHVLDNRLYANLSVLCDCIEDICSAFVIKCRMDPAFNQLSLHDVVLPCSWLLFPHKYTAEKDTNLFLMGKLLDEIARLVEALRVEAGMEFLWLNHTKFTPILRNVFISRICRILCLLAHNIRNPFMRDKIDMIILSLHKTNPPSNWPLANYRKLVDDVVRYMTPLPGRSPPSDGYLRALLAFDDNKGVSNLVHLVHKTMNQYTRVHVVRRLVYEKVIEIPHLLSSYAVVAQSTLRVEAPAFVPRLGPSKDQPEVTQEEDVTVNADTETRDALENEAVTLLAPDLDESLRSNRPSVEEEEAARKIQNVYRRYVRRRSSRAVNAEIDVIFMTCLKETQSSEWLPGYYSFLFLGPLPHLLLCLERGIALTRAAKAKTKGLLNKESHEKLEELGKQRSEIAALLRKGLRLRKQLEPSSPAHRVRDIDALKGGVLEVKEFMHRVPGNVQGIQSDFQMAYKGIVAKKVHVPVGKEKERPALNVEDMDY
ncbi:uncharacterized protein EDB93DRAFT_708493 [Suillus bovinus]|uniref:uncharacterized protein n=1 Tax=Suillus bovinus TaxID=48563 RepID=UPI001B870828|nr:uncharacterized protein EDB93DRAFT_708493 [Suillus bovinus]KAG2139121.1 hypothetical protein EDB93DRAFT_708493 [Suillus bovinus]